MEIQHRILKVMIIITSLIGGLVLSASANILTNGSFETQIPVTNTPAGWATKLDGTYWMGNTQTGAASAVFKVNTFAGTDGDYYIRRYIYKATGISTISCSSVFYNLSDLSLPAGTTDLVFSLYTTDTSGVADIGKMATYGSLVFYSGTNGAGSVVGTYETSRLIASTSTNWVQLSVTSSIPVSALSFKVTGNVAVYGVLSGDSAGQRFDGFKLEASIPPPKVCLFLIR